MGELSANEALKIIEAVRDAGREAKISISVAVVDAGGNMLAFLRMDGALLASVESSQVKARTALFFGTETLNLPFDQPFTPALLGSVSYPVAFVPGGIPVRWNGRLVGAVGVGGGTGEQDHGIAKLAVEAVTGVASSARS